MIWNILSSAVYFNCFRALDNHLFNFFEGLFEPMPSWRAFLQGLSGFAKKKKTLFENSLSGKLKYNEFRGLI